MARGIIRGGRSHNKSVLRQIYVHLASQGRTLVEESVMACGQQLPAHAAETA